MLGTAETRIETEATARAKYLAKGRAFCDVDDYGAKGDGTDDLDAFIAARDAANLAGHGRIYAGGKTYGLRDEFRLGSNNELFGAGKLRTTLRLTAAAPPSCALVTNADIAAGNIQVWVHDLALDLQCSSAWRCPSEATFPGGSRSSCLTFRNVQHGYVDRVLAINAGLHGFDITCASLHVPVRAACSRALPQERHADRCEASGFGDDGFTTHHSEHLFISNSYSHDPRNRGNQNGFEIDDGSRYVTLTNNTSENCFGGVEIKAHATASAAFGVIINGHRSIQDVRSYNWRHIGHHKLTDPMSQTARDIVATNLFSIRPATGSASMAATPPPGQS